MLTLLGTIGGGLFGYFIAPYIGTFLQTTLTFGIPTVTMSGGTLAIGITTATVTGTQIAIVGSTIATSVYMFAKSDIKQVNQAANQAGIPKNLRPQFGKFIEMENKAMGLGTGATIPYKELIELAYDFIKEVIDKIK